MAINSNLYPPIVDTYMPAFLINSEDEEKNICKVYFSISQYNSLSNIRNAQVTVRYQTTNLSALNSEKYPSEIKLTNIEIDETIESDYKYYIILNPDDIKNGFQIDQYYKVQIRFTEKTATPRDLSIPQNIDSWLSQNLEKFSEWSTVTLIRGISVPTLELKDFSEDETGEITWSTARTQLVGTLTFEDENESEFLRSYRIKLYNNIDELLFDSDVIYSNNYNDINSFSYSLPYLFPSHGQYYFEITYTTQNFYSETLKYNFVVKQDASKELNLIMEGKKDPENGRIELHLRRNKEKLPYSGCIYIRRTSSKSNFTYWEDVYSKHFSNEDIIDFRWYDYTIESGVWYNYAIQSVSDDGVRGVMVKFMEPAMMEFEHMYLTGAERQLKIAFNPTVSSLKRTLSESKIDTLGSQYPFITRNAYMNYTQIPLSGLISSEADEDNLFTSKEELYGKQYDLYEQYNKENNISSHSDWIYEKAFRNKVEDFLYDGDVKILRSPTEGNFLVKIMDISLSPNQTLGRRLWTFNGTAYEIDDFTLDKCEEYGILERSE